MLLKELNSKIHPNMIKHVAEILLDSDGDSQYYEYLDTKSFSKDGFSELRNALSQTTYTKDVESLIDRIRIYILKNGVETILKDFCRISKMKNILKSKIKYKTSMEDFNKILVDFLKTFGMGSQHQYSFDSGSCAGWIINSFGYYVISEESSKFIASIVNERGSLVNGAEGEMSLNNYLEVSFKEKHSTFSFREDVYNIFRASELLFSTNRRTKGSLSTDIVTNYKVYKINLGLDDLCNSIETVYCPRGGKMNKERFLSDNIYFTKINIDRPLMIEGSDYRRATYKVRNCITDELYKFIGKRLRAEDVEALYSRVLDIDQFGVTSNNIGVILNHKVDDPYDLSDNKEKFMILINGLLSLNQLIKYCDDSDLDLFSIPESIFRTDNYYKRFNSMEDCLKCFKFTSKLIEEETKNICIELESNDSFFDSLAKKAKYNFLTIKEIIESYNSEEKREVRIGEFYSRVCRDYDKEIHLMVDLIKYVSSTYKTFGEACFHTDDIELIKKLKLCLTHEHLIKICEPIHSKLEFVDTVARYVILRVTILKKLKLMLDSFIGDTEFDKIQKIDKEEISTISETIESLEDLSNLRIDSSLINNLGNIDDTDELDDGTISVMSLSYKLLYNEYEDVIKFCNLKFNEYVRKYERDGIEVGLAYMLSEKLIMASGSIYMSREVIQNASFNNFKQMPFCRIKQGYVFNRNMPLIHQGCYVHENGWLVRQDGEIINQLEERDRF